VETAVPFLLFLLVMLVVILFLMRRTLTKRHSPRFHFTRGGRSGKSDRDTSAPDSPMSLLEAFGPGGLFDLQPTKPGVWSRSFSLDPETGRWVDTSPVKQGSTGALGRAPSAARRAAHPSQIFGSLLQGIDSSGGFDVEPASELHTFKDVGGMEDLKQEVRDTIGLLLKHPDDAQRYGIEWNGVLLHGPPGVGKTFFARAIAGEHGLNLIHVSTGDLVTALVGGSAHNIEKAFDTALGNLPCLLFFDEFDSVAQRREGSADQESRRTVNQLLTSLEAHRDERRLLVMAATNSVEHLDPAVIRPGRFDRHIRIDLPDEGGRRAVFLSELEDRPRAENIDLEPLVQRTEGMTPAAIEKIVDSAALTVFREATSSGKDLKVETEHLLSAIERYGGQDRPTVEHWTWDSLVLPAEIKAQLQQIQAVIEDPESAQRFGVSPPTGLLLAGPPGTGKTTIGKVLAAQARCSFYPISGADITSKWVGESEDNIQRLFERARENRPSIIFIDELDAIAGRRDGLAVQHGLVNQLLVEIDGMAGQRGLFIVGATNRPDQLDPALLRGGRLSRTIVIGLPDEAGRLAILRLYTARMPTVAVRLEDLATDTHGSSPADLKALCQEAALVAMARTTPRDERQDEAEAPAAVTHEDFEEALSRLRSSVHP
jgi:transitional endoplasmic reticulum ATPase